MHVAKAKLVHIIHRGTETFTAEYEIDEEPIIAGWHKDRQIYIRDPSVSPFHFKIFFHNQHWWIEDLNSPKGTRLNGINTAIQRLCHMDIIGAGASELQFQIVSNSSSITLAPDLCKKQSQIDYTSNHRLAVPLRASLRIVLDNLLKTDSDFDAFCLDYFPQVKNRLTNGMDRVAKMNLLIETSEYDDIPKALLNARYAPYINIKNPDKDLAWIMEKMLEVKLPQNDEYIPSLTRILGNPRILKGFSLDKYIIGDYLGHGGSGIVFRAQNSLTGARVAIKLLFPVNGTGEATIFNILCREFRALSSLEHPNVIKMFDLGKCFLLKDTIFFLVMQFLDGIRLDWWIHFEGGKSADFKVKLNIACMLADALRYCHAHKYFDEFGISRQSILHGDVKPENVIIDSNFRPILYDFLITDLQRLIDPRLAPRGRFTYGFGTEGYMDDEQASKGLITDKSDIFAFGKTLEELFKVDDTNSLSGRISVLSKQISGFIQTMTSSSAIDRPQSMGEVCEYLNKIRSQDGNS